MNLTENTKVRIKVPKHLYESIQAELGKMEEKKHEDSMEEGNYDPENTMEEGEEMKEYVGMSPAEMQAMELAGQILAAVAAGTGLTAGIVNLAKKVKDKIKSKKSGEAPMAEELEEVFDLDFGGLMEAMKDASKKKAEAKKKKEVEDKKKKVEDDKKKKEVEAKKKAEAAKKK
jgi:IMP dehydrogenase/GMP reductase